MSRYFFNSVDGHRETDLDGVDHADETAAQRMAMHYAGEVLQSNPQKVWTDGRWRVEVTDERGVLLFTIITLAIDAPRMPPSAA